MTKWIYIKDKHAPSMKTVLLAWEGGVTVGWNEAVQPDEDAQYYSCEFRDWPMTIYAWAHLPPKPTVKIRTVCEKKDD